MFEQFKGKHDAKREIFTIDASTGLALSPFTVRIIDKAKKKKQKLTASINGRRTGNLVIRLTKSLTSVKSIEAEAEKNEDPVSKGFSDFIIYERQSDIIKNYVALFQLYTKHAVMYRRYLEKLERRLFAYYAAASLYVSIDPKANSAMKRLEHGLSEPPVILGLQELYDYIPVSLKATLPKITTI